ncbi:hypothetical protein HBH99_256540, partial [Parastagonospora nodorum]
MYEVYLFRVRVLFGVIELLGDEEHDGTQGFAPPLSPGAPNAPAGAAGFTLSRDDRPEPQSASPTITETVSRLQETPSQSSIDLGLAPIPNSRSLFHMPRSVETTSNAEPNGIQSRDPGVVENLMNEPIMHAQNQQAYGSGKRHIDDLVGESIEPPPKRQAIAGFAPLE